MMSCLYGRWEWEMKHFFKQNNIKVIWWISVIFMMNIYIVMNCVLDKYDEPRTTDFLGNRIFMKMTFFEKNAGVLTWATAMVGRRRSQTSRLVLNKPPTVLIINIIDPIGFRPSVLPFSVPPNPALSSPNSLRRILSCRVPSGWTMPRGRPQASWLRQVESYLRDTGMAGLASVWAMAKRKPKEYRRKVDAATVKNIRDTYQGIWQLT